MTNLQFKIKLTIKDNLSSPEWCPAAQELRVPDWIRPWLIMLHLIQGWISRGGTEAGIGWCCKRDMLCLFIGIFVWFVLSIALNFTVWPWPLNTHINTHETTSGLFNPVLSNSTSAFRHPQVWTHSVLQPYGCTVTNALPQHIKMQKRGDWGEGRKKATQGTSNLLTIKGGKTGALLRGGRRAKHNGSGDLTGHQRRAKPEQSKTGSPN